LSREQVDVVEADSFWCVSALLDTIQDNYTFAQPGIQRKVNDLRELISRVEREQFLPNRARKSSNLAIECTLWPVGPVSRVSITELGHKRPLNGHSVPF
jgi:hypothetical protein